MSKTHEEKLIERVVYEGLDWAIVHNLKGKVSRGAKGDTGYRVSMVTGSSHYSIRSRYQIGFNLVNDLDNENTPWYIYGDKQAYKDLIVKLGLEDQMPESLREYFNKHLEKLPWLRE